MNALGSLSAASLLLDRSGAATRMRAAPQLLVVSGSVSTGTLSTGAAPDSIYSVNHVDANKLRVNLMERLGKAFDMDMDDFAEPGDMARAIKTIVSKMQPGAVQEVEKSLGLDKLGVTLGELLDAMIDPSGNANKKLMGALRLAAGELEDKDAGSVRPSLGLGLDEIGRYSATTIRR